MLLPRNTPLHHQKGLLSENIDSNQVCEYSTTRRMPDHTEKTGNVKFRNLRVQSEMDRWKVGRSCYILTGRPVRRISSPGFPCTRPAAVNDDNLLSSFRKSVCSHETTRTGSNYDIVIRSSLESFSNL